MSLIYKIVAKELWQRAEYIGHFDGSEVDIADGYIHFSTDQQLAETANKHFKGQTDLLLITIDETRISGDLRYEISRGGALFPHLYGNLLLDAVVGVTAFEPDSDGLFSFSEILS